MPVLYPESLIYDSRLQLQQSSMLEIDYLFFKTYCLLFQSEADFILRPFGKSPFFTTKRVLHIISFLFSLHRFCLFVLRLLFHCIDSSLLLSFYFPLYDIICPS